VRIAGAALLLRLGAVFSGRTAAVLLGARELFDPAGPVEVTVPPGRSFGPVAGLRVRRAPLPAHDVCMIHRRPCTTGVRTAVDIARREPLMAAVPAVDVLLRGAVVGAGELRAAVTGLATGRGTRQARRVVSLADGRAESPPESRVRVLLTLAGLRPVPQYTVTTADGVFVARVDLAYPQHRVAVEYDGLWHADTAQFRKDRRRLNALVAAGWTVLHLTAVDLHQPEVVVTRVRQLLFRREIGELGLEGPLGGPTSPISMRP